MSSPSITKDLLENLPMFSDAVINYAAAEEQKFMSTAVVEKM